VSLHALLPVDTAASEPRARKWSACNLSTALLEQLAGAARGSSSAAQNDEGGPILNPRRALAPFMLTIISCVFAGFPDESSKPSEPTATEDSEQPATPQDDELSQVVEDEADDSNGAAASADAADATKTDEDVDDAEADASATAMEASDPADATVMFEAATMPDAERQADAAADLSRDADAGRSISFGGRAVEAVMAQSFTTLGVSGSIAFDAYPLILFKDGTACTNINFAMSTESADAYQARVPRDWTLWKIFNNKVAIGSGDRYTVTPRHAPS
jgi:hypothetical protein